MSDIAIQAGLSRAILEGGGTPTCARWVLDGPDEGSS
jgi:hypothetical protein